MAGSARLQWRVLGRLRPVWPPVSKRLFPWGGDIWRIQVSTGDGRVTCGTWSTNHTDGTTGTQEGTTAPSGQPAHIPLT
eukprot:3718174-Prymnesium_polylepis.1